MTLRVLIWNNVVKNIFEISENFKIVPTPIFRADSKSVIYFFIRLKFNLQFKKRPVNDLRNISEHEPFNMRSSCSDTLFGHSIEYLVHKSFFVDLFVRLRTSPHLHFISLQSKVIIILLQNRVPDHNGTRSYLQNPVTQNSRTAQELSDNVKIIGNGQDLTM